MEAIRRMLASSLVFRGLEDAELTELIPHCRVMRVAKGRFLFLRGQKSFGFFIVESGAINLHRVDSKGRDIILCVFRRGDSFAEGTISALQTYPANAKAVENSRVLVIDRIGFLGYIHLHPSVSLRILESMGLRNRFLVKQLEGLRGMESDDRLIEWLLRSARPDPTGTHHAVLLENPKKVLASELGVTPETLSRALARLRARGLISVRGRTITIPDRTALRLGCTSAAED